MRQALAMGLALAAFAAAPQAMADAIDGEWCSGKGLNIEIQGPKIRLPSGATINGQYSRHEFAYEAPKNSDEAGSVIYMEQQSEEEMLLRRLKEGMVSEPELWRRCNVTSSLSCHRRIYSGDPWCQMTARSELPHDGSPQQVRG